MTDADIPVAGGSFPFRDAGFQTGSQLTIGTTTVTATGADVSADGTLLTLPVPAHAVGTVGFTVTNPGTGHAATGTITYGISTLLPVPAPVSGRTGSPGVLPGSRPAAPSSPAVQPNPLPKSR